MASLNPISLQPVDVLQSNERYLTATWDRFFMMNFSGAFSAQDLDDIMASFADFARSHGGNVGTVVVFESNSPLPGDDVRKRGSSLLRGLPVTPRAGVALLLGEGFWASASRSVLTAILFLARYPYPYRAFGNLEDGASWLCDQLEVPTATDGLKRAIEIIRDY